MRRPHGYGSEFPVTADLLVPMKNAGALSALDIHFSRFMERLNGSPSSELALAAALLSSVTRQGHICLDLALPEEACQLGASGTGQGMTCPPAPLWREALLACSVVGRPGMFRPMVLDDEGRLYLFRYWDYQDKLARRILDRVSAPLRLRESSGATLRSLLETLFPAAGSFESGGEADWQKIAAFTAATRKFCVISGGPGTGKTTTVARILFLLAAMAKPRELRIALAAPTGKAAARLQEAIKKARKDLPQEADVLKSLPETASTLHRLLGTVLHSPYFRHHAGNPLPLDVVVVDEASMVDLALMSKLVQALLPQARLILLGDKDQLSSVEAGAVLGDLCDAGRPLDHSADFLKEIEIFCGPVPKKTAASVLELRSKPGGKRKPKDGIIQLEKNYRFSAHSGIAELSRAVRDLGGDRAMEILKEGSRGDVRWLDPGRRERGFAHHLERLVKEGYGDYFDGISRIGRVTGEADHAQVGVLFLLLDRFRILCALREGPRGVAGLNGQVEGLIGDWGWAESRRSWYAGKPVMIRRNDYQLGLFNGDIGICLPDGSSGGELRVFFPREDGTFRAHHVLRLPENETVYAMTVHKSQGSEFDRVLFVLPDRDTPVLTRELVYTAITRAREEILVWTDEDIFEKAVSRRTRRLSGLADALWGEGA